MNFIEKVLGISPDGGNGVTEVTLLLALGLVVTAAFFAVRRTIATRRPSRASSKLPK